MSNHLFLLLAQTDEGGIPAAPRNVHEGSYWFPENASSFARDIDSLFMLIFWVSLVFFAGIVGAMMLFVIKYRRRPGHKLEKSPSHNTALEIAWSVLPGFLLIWFFVDGANGFFKQRIVPGDAEQINVIAQQFNWVFIYPNGDMSTELHLVQNQSVEFIMESRDVLHSFFVPAFRQKQDVVPGRYTSTWVKPTRTGTYRLYCSEYCGDSHSLMKTNVTVHTTHAQRDAATAWLWEEKTPIENGKRLFNMQCSGCHNPTTEKKTGPGLAEIWGKTETFDDGSTGVVDDNYIRESILEPNAKIVAGYARPSQMNSFDGKLSPDQLLWLRLYIKSLTPGVSLDEPEEPAVEGEAATGESGEAEGQGVQAEQPETESDDKAAEPAAAGAGDGG